MRKVRKKKTKGKEEKNEVEKSSKFIYIHTRIWYVLTVAFDVPVICVPFGTESFVPKFLNRFRRSLVFHDSFPFSFSLSYSAFPLVPIIAPLLRFRLLRCMSRKSWIAWIDFLRKLKCYNVCCYSCRKLSRMSSLKRLFRIERSIGIWIPTCWFSPLNLNCVSVVAVATRLKFNGTCNVCIFSFLFPFVKNELRWRRIPLMQCFH